jgi:tRNA dimethylallyltransferase
MRLAEAMQAEGKTIEIVSMDSALVYRDMDIGTAKPSKAEQEQVRHHLIDILDPSEAYSAACFARDVKQRIREIQERDHIPLIVGGTMLYWRAWVYGLSNMPPANPEIRQRLDEQAIQLGGWPAMHAELAKVDAITAARLKPNDSQRIQRALEVFHITGKPISNLFAQAPEGDGRSGEPIPNWIKAVSLEPSDRGTLHALLEKRFDDMLKNGLIDEVRKLHQRGDLHENLPAIRSVGYRQVWEYLNGQTNLERMREKGLAATRQLSKRQSTWLRAMDRTVFDPVQSKGFEEALAYCKNYLISQD